MSETERWTYTAGSRPEGAVVYDDDSKLHSHHDSDPARGQHNAFDLVRLHKFGHLDTDPSLPITEQPSYRAMCDLARAQPEVQAAQVDEAFEDLGEAPPETQPDAPKGPLARPLSDVLAHPTAPRWLLEDELERGVIALMAGQRGSYKSFKALDWGMRVALQGLPVYAISAEGGDFDRRARAYLAHFEPDREPADVPMYVVERRLNLSDKAGVELIRQDCKTLGIRPALFILDTFSKLSGGLDENDNSEVKLFIGRLDNGLKREFDATVLVVAHTGHADKTRARGASALGADTDAEYIVTRMPGGDAVCVTRERFKSSPELQPLFYKHKVVDLGYADSYGRPVTSLVLEPTEETKRATLAVPRGANQIFIYETLQEMAPDGSVVDVQQLLLKTISKVPEDTTLSRNSLRTGLAKAIKDLAAKGIIFKHGDGVSLTAVLATDDEEDFLA